MEDSVEDATDGTSIKPVSSLRSHFEQMANSKPDPKIVIPRETSPKPGPKTAIPHQNGQNGKNAFEIPQSAGGLSGPRGRPWDSFNQPGLRPPALNDDRTPSVSPTRPLRKIPQPLVDVVSPRAPAVNVEPPHSPPKVLSSTLSSPSELLEAPNNSPGRSGWSSPHNFRSRPTTPMEGRKMSLSPVQPPEPPPPRRSGEFRRESSATLHTMPPPVNRAEKPKPATKPPNLHDRREREAPMLAASTNRASSNGTSPFSTPPQSASPERIVFSANVLSPRQDLVPSGARTPVGAGIHNPPPVHPAVASRRREQEASVNGRAYMSPHTTGEPENKPALPARPIMAVASHPKIPTTPRSLSDRLNGHQPARSHTVDDTIISAKRVVTPAAPQPPSEGTSFATPPKRIVSNPSTKKLTSPQHGRSMTVDRAAARPDLTSASVATSQPEIRSSRASSITAPYSNAEYPNPSLSNRRPPYFDEGPSEISTKYDTRAFDVCGEHVATAGQVVRVWSLIDGELLVNHSAGEQIKVVSLAFKPASDVDAEGSRLWVGTSAGELQEIDVATRSVVATRAGAHTRREIIKIYRHCNEMWTLDDGGTLHLWGPDSSGAPGLTNPTQSFRLPKGHTFSIIVGHELWHATGKEIRVFCPTGDGSAQFQILARPLSQPTAGDVTSGAVLDSQPDRVYFGHSDGKVTIYARNDYACLGIFNVSVYKINSLSGVGDYLWGGFNTGMIYVYDTTKTPWEVKKDWRAHENPVVSVTADRSSFWTMGRSQVLSLGADNVLRIWDGMLQDDWLETEMQAQDQTFCSFQQIKTLVMTWNAGASTPSSLRYADQDASFFPNLLSDSDSPDILVFGFQELVDLEDKKTTAKSFFKSSKKKEKKDSSEPEHMSHQYRDWRDYLTRCLDDHLNHDLYHLIHTASLVGLFTCIFVKAGLRDRIHNISAAEVKRGMGGTFGNKGALVVRFTLDDSSLCFVNCHLAAGQSQTPNRNNDISAILEGSILPPERSAHTRQDIYVGGGDGSMILDHEICVLNGDLNYRIDTMGRDTVVGAVKANNLAKLLERDQLLLSRRKNPGFRLRAFTEMPITFAPTYKYDVGTDNYDTSDKKRSPAWCDRILFRGRDRIEQVNYRRHEVRVSDHRPVTGLFRMLIKSVLPKERSRAWVDCEAKFNALKERRAMESSLDFLTTTCGFDMESSRRLIQERNATQSRAMQKGAIQKSAMQDRPG